MTWKSHVAPEPTRRNRPRGRKIEGRMRQPLGEIAATARVHNRTSWAIGAAAAAVPPSADSDRRSGDHPA